MAPASLLLLAGQLLLVPKTFLYLKIDPREHENSHKGLVAAANEDRSRQNLILNSPAPASETLRNIETAHKSLFFFYTKFTPIVFVFLSLMNV